MGKIKTLPAEVIRKIAAGEVVERPASVVKELIENALDAGATSIKTEVEEAGVKKIVVTDNGCGMDKEDIMSCMLAHTTSKISSEEDLAAIHSLGFRGEALASIAAVSSLIIKSKIKEDAAGSGIEAYGGRVARAFALGMPVGTQVIVEDLFSHLPVRKKFLGEVQTELRCISDVVADAALAHPEARFSLVHNGRSIGEFPPVDTRQLRIASLLGEDTAKFLQPLSWADDYIQMEGYIGAPHLARRQKNYQYVFVNNRPITHAGIAETIRRSYGKLIAPELYPVFLLFLTVHPVDVDVHIHPRKEEVNFKNQRRVLDILQQTLDALLEKQRASADNLMGREDYTASVLRDAGPVWSPRTVWLPEDEILQLNNVYLIAKTEQGVLFIDQHAAHESILYEELLQTFQKEQEVGKKYDLPQAIVMDIPQVQVGDWEESLYSLKQMGFDIEHFGGRTLKINVVPYLFKERDIPVLISTLWDDLAHNSSVLDMVSERTVTYLACRTAIKAGDILSQEERKKLLEKLLAGNQYLTCPHGRPTRIEIPLRELHAMFKRR